MAKRMWLRHLGGFSSLAVAEVMDMVPDRFPSYCPKLGEIKALLRERMVRLEYRHENPPLIQMTEAQRISGRKHVGEILKRLKFERRDEK